MTIGPWLKEQNAWLLRTALFAHIAAFAYVAFEPLVLASLAEPDVLRKAKEALAPGSIAVAVIAIAKLLLLGLVPARLRDRPHETMRAQAAGLTEQDMADIAAWFADFGRDSGGGQ